MLILGLPYLSLIGKTASWDAVIDDKLHHWWARGVGILPNILLAVFVLIVFFLLARFLKRVINRFILRISKKRSVGMLLPEIIRILVIIVGLYIALNVLSLDKIAVSLLAGAGIVGLTLAFAFQDLTANFISGIYIDLNNPFEIGDIIKSGDIMGEVEEIGLRSTSIHTGEGLHILVPNKNIFQNPITNYSKEKKKQITINFTISVQDNLGQIEKMVVSAVASVKGVGSGDSVALYFTDIDQNNLKASIIFWCVENGINDLKRIKHNAILAILNAFKENQIQRLK